MPYSPESIEGARSFYPSDEELALAKAGPGKYPKKVLLKLAIELDPDAVAEAYKEGWTREDILRLIERLVKKGTLEGPTKEGGRYILDTEVLDSEVE